MEKWIYKITNTINNKIYVGQSKNPIKRFREHVYESTKEEVNGLHAAMKKYGTDKFKMEILEGPIENYNDREKYWIKFYDAYHNGYNLIEGGEEPPVFTGENSALYKFSDATIKQVCEMLKDQNIAYTEISKKFNISLSYIQRINTGKERQQEGYVYPIRVQPNVCFSDEKVAAIISDLLNTTKSTEAIAREHEVDSLSVYRINKGHSKIQKDLEYPIRRDGERISQKQLEDIILDLSNKNLKMSSIEAKYGISKSTLSRINNGKTHVRDFLVYPIRSSKNRVYKENL